MLGYFPLPCVAPRGLSPRRPLCTLIGQQHVRVREIECCFSVWQCVSCHDVVCTAHCSHTKLYLPRYKSLGRTPGKVNKSGKVRQTGDGARVHVCYYVLHWFYAEVYHILELSRNKQVEAVPDPTRHQTMNSRRRDCQGMLLFFFYFYFPKLLAGKNSSVYLPRLQCNEVKLFSNLTDDGII